MLKQIGILVAGSALLISSNVFAGATKAKADDAILKAMSANAAAKEVGYEWRDTGKMIKQAKKMVSEKNYNAAFKTAKKAEAQGINALAQYHSENKRFAKNHH